MTLEKHWIARGFSVAATSYDATACLQYETGLALFDQLKKSGIHSHHLLDMGCGTGRMTHVLAQYWLDNSITAIDCASGMIKYANHEYSHPSIHYVCADIEDFNFPSEAYDVIWSNFSLQWCFNLTALFEKLKNSLTQQSVLAFSIPVETTLHELKTSWQSIDGYDHVNEFISSPVLLSLLRKSGFEIISLAQEKKIQWHPDFQSIVRSLRGVGVHNVHNTRAPGLTGKRHWQALMNAYERYRVPNQGLPVTYDIISILAGKIK